MTSPAFYEWLNVATRGLPVKAAARLRADAEALYTDEFLKALRDGVGQGAARAWAITALGDPHAARRRFLDDLPNKSFPVATALDKWAAVATKDLCAAAKTRVATEVEAHYWEVFRAAKQDGLNDARAVAEAMGALGDAKKARRRFRKHYLTTMEAQLVEFVAKPRTAREKRKALLFPGLQLLLALMLLSTGPHGLAYAQAGLGAAAFATILAVVWGRRAPRAVIAAHLALVPIGVLGAAIGLTAMSLEKFKDLQVYKLSPVENFGFLLGTGLLGLLLCVGAPYLVNLYISVLRKLRHKHNWESIGSGGGGSTND